MFPPKKKPRPRPSTGFPVVAALRAVLLAAAAVGVAVYALVRAYTHPRRPMVVPVPSSSVPAAPSASEVPAPELEVIDP